MVGYYDSGKKFKAFLMITLILILINGIISYQSYKNKSSFFASEGRFIFVSQTEDEIVFKDMDKNPLRVVIENKTPNEISFARQYKVYYKDRIIESDSSKFKTEGLIITQSDGAKYIEKFTDDEYTKVYKLNIPQESLPNDVQIIYSVEKVHHVLEDNQSLKLFFWIAAATIIGCLLIVFPGWLLDSDIIIGIIVLIGLGIILGAFFYNIIYAFFL